MMDRRTFVAFATGASLLSPTAIRAQQTAKVSRIGVLLSGSPSSVESSDEFRQGLSDLGYKAGKNVVLVYRFAEGHRDRLPKLAADLVGEQVDVIVVAGVSAAEAARRATTTIPIVVGYAGDLVGTGLVASLAKPGGNITGSTEISPDVSGKRLALMKEAFPRATKVAVLWYPRQGGSDEEELRQTETAAHQLGMAVQVVAVRDPDDFQGAFAAMAKQQAGAVILIRGSFTEFHDKALLALALKHRLPSICEPAQWADDGCLMSYGPDYAYLWRRAATFVDKILKGARPGDLPVEQPTRFGLVLNMKTANALGLTIPQSLLLRADRVIQ
jgi:putative tryptophan/tyrosine transport system substrate-binding protein